MLIKFIFINIKNKYKNSPTNICNAKDVTANNTR
jgi:hypothetical protein